LLTLLLNLAIKKVTPLGPRTPHQPEKLKKLSKNNLLVLLLFFQSMKNRSLQPHVFSIECSVFTGGCPELVQLHPALSVRRLAQRGFAPFQIGKGRPSLFLQAASRL
jgi:hypothetical protein